MSILKIPVSNQHQQPTLSLKLDASAIIDKDIRRVTLGDAHKLENQRQNHVFFEKLKSIFQDAEEEEKVQREEATLFDIFLKYRRNVCYNFPCQYRGIFSTHCATCLLAAQSFHFFISDDTITYFHIISSNIEFNSSKDMKKLLSNFSRIIDLPNSSNMAPQTYFPNIEEVKVLLYWHREDVRLNLKTPQIKQISNVINYSSPINIIHYQLAQRMLLLYHTADAITFHDDSARQIDQFQRERDAVLYKKFQIHASLNSSIEKILSQRTDRVNYIIRNNFNDTKNFEKMTRTLLTISKSNPDTVKQIAVMLAKTFVGRPYLNYLDKNTNHLTLIITNNYEYVRRFLTDIFSYNLIFGEERQFDKTFLDQHKYIQKNENSYYHVTEYSAASLSDEKNIGEFIQEKFMGNIVNIDTTATFAGPNFKALVEGSVIYHTDPYFGKLQYRSNAHYIRINHDARQSGLGNYNISYDTIFCNGNLSNAIYEPLDDYELFFIVTGFVNYGIDLLSQSDYEPTMVLTPIELVNEFIEKFCDDTTNTVSLTSEISAIEDEAKAKELGISQLPFTHVDILAEFFDKWCAITYKDINYDTNTIKNTFISKYPKIFYLKKKVVTLFGKSKDARGICGLYFDHDRFIKFTNENDLSAEIDKSSPKEFISYMEDILTAYFPVNNNKG